MTWEEYLAEAGRPKRAVRHDESRLQEWCFRYFRGRWPGLAAVFFAVPNGAHVGARHAAVLKREGLTAGVSDAVLLVPRGGWHGLLVEFKTEKGRQSAAQRAWQEAAEAQGYRYEVVRDAGRFIELAEEYLGSGATRGGMGQDDFRTE